MAASGEPVYCICRKPYDETQFMIECDRCQEWFHGSCVGILEHQAQHIERYHCPHCEVTHGPLVLKERPDFQDRDYSTDGNTNIMRLVKELKQRSFPSAGEVVKRMHGRDLTVSYWDTNGFDVPLLVEKKDGLGLRVPAPSITVEDIEKRIGSMFEIEVINVARQEDHKMLMRHWTEYYNCPNKREMILNVISLEFSKTPLSELVEPPRVVKEVSWVSSLWPDDMPDDMVPQRPDVQKYCLMGVKDSFTDFHIDFGGTSVWYHVLKGEKVFYLVRPSEENLGLFESWMSSSKQSETFFGDMVDCCWKQVVRQGQTLFIPTGWIHAVYTPIDSLVFGGNFLHNYNIPLQLEVYEIERRVKTQEKYLFPSYETVSWFAAKNILDILKGCSDGNETPPQHIVKGGAALSMHLKKWTQRKDLNNKCVYTKKGDDPAQLEGIQYGKLIRELNTLVKKWNTETPSKGSRKSEKKSGKKSSKKKKKKEQPAPEPLMHGLDLLHQQTEERLKVLDEEQRKNIYNFEEEDEPPAPTVLKVRIPKPGALADKEQEQKVPPVKLGGWTKDVGDAKKTKRKKGGKKGKTAAPDTKEEVKVEDEPNSGGFKFRLSKGKIFPPLGDDTSPVDMGSKQAFQPLVPPPTVKEEEDEDSDKDTLVVDENPRAQQINRKSSAVTTSAPAAAASKPEPLFMTLNFGGGKKTTGEGAGSVPGAVGGTKKTPAEGAGSASSKPDSASWRQNTPSLLGGGGTIADILHVTASDYKAETNIRTSPSSQSQMLAIEGMLSMSQGSRPTPSIFSQSPRKPFSPNQKDEEEQLMSDCYQDGEFMYPSFEMSDEEQVGSKPVKVQEKDDNWNPKARVAVPTKAEERTQRVGAKNQAVASGLAATAKKLAEAPPVPKKPSKKSGGSKNKVIEPEFEVKPLPGPSTDFMGTGNAFRPGVKRVVDRTSPTPPPKPKKAKKGMATAKQRLSKILKMNKLIY